MGSDYNRFLVRIVHSCGRTTIKHVIASTISQRLILSDFFLNETFHETIDLKMVSALYPIWESQRRELVPNQKQLFENPQTIAS